MTKGRLDKKQRQDDQRRKRTQAASALATGAKNSLPPAHYPIKRVALGKRQVPGGAGHEPL